MYPAGSTYWASQRVVTHPLAVVVSQLEAASTSPLKDCTVQFSSVPRVYLGDGDVFDSVQRLPAVTNGPGGQHRPGPSPSRVGTALSTGARVLISTAHAAKIKS